MAITSESPDTGKQASWAWNPSVPIPDVPVFVWPLQIVNAIRFLFSWEFMGSVIIPFGLLAWATWSFPAATAGGV